MADNETTRFSLLEIDDNIPPAPPEPPTPEEIAVQSVEPAALAQDPIDAFRDRMREQRRERPRYPIDSGNVAVDTVRVDPPAYQSAAPARRETRDELMAVARPDETTGAVVYWTLSGNVDLALLTNAWTAAGLPADWLPSGPSCKVALGRASKAQQTKTTLARQDPRGGYSFVFENGDGGKLTYDVGPRAFLLAGDLLRVEDPDGATNEDSLISQSVRAAYEKALRTIDGTDASGWLTTIVLRLGAVSLRQSGGIYFVPRDGMARLSAAKACIQAASSHSVFEIPAMNSAEAAHAIFYAVGREIDELGEKLRGELADGIGSRAIATRLESIEGLAERVARYERLFGQPMAGAVTQLSAMRKSVDEHASRGSLLEVG